MNVARNRIIRGQPLPGDEYRLIVSGVRYANVGAYGEEAAYVEIYGNMDAVFCARLALCYVDHSWLDGHGLRLGIERLAGETTEEIEANARRAKAYYEAYRYDPMEDMENIRITTVPTGDTRWLGRE